MKQMKMGPAGRRYIGMLAAVALATVVAWVLRKINY